MHLFVTFLRTSAPSSGPGQGVLDDLRAAVRGAKGDSRTELDRALGRKLAKSEAPLRAWLQTAIAREQSLPPVRWPAALTGRAAAAGVHLAPTCR